MKTVLAIAGGLLMGWSFAYSAVLFSTGWLVVSPLLTAAGVLAYGTTRIFPYPRSRLEAVLAALVGWLILSLAMMFSVPNIYGLLPIPTEERHATISNKHRMGRLPYRVSFLEHDCPLCGIRVPREKWRALEIGSRVRLTVIRSPFGYIVKDISDPHHAPGNAPQRSSVPAALGASEARPHTHGYSRRGLKNSTIRCVALNAANSRTLNTLSSGVSKRWLV